MIHNVIGSRLPYDYQLSFPLLKAIINMKKYGLTKPAERLGGILVPDMFLMPMPGLFLKMKRKGYGQYIRFSLF